MCLWEAEAPFKVWLNELKFLWPVMRHGSESLQQVQFLHLKILLACFFLWQASASNNMAVYSIDMVLSCYSSSVIDLEIL